MYKEDWAIANVANLGPNFTLLSGSNQRIVTQAAVGNASGTTAGWYRYNVGKMASDNVRLDCLMITPTAGTLNAASVSAWMLARLPDVFSTAGAAGRYAAFAFLQNGGWSIYTGLQATLTNQLSGTLAGGFTLPCIVSFLAVGSTYLALYNGNPIPGAVWQDTGGLVSVGATKRNWGLLPQCMATNQQHPSFDFAAAADLSGQFFAA